MLQYNWTSVTIETNKAAQEMLDTFNKVQPMYGAFDTETTGLHIKLDRPFLFQFGFVDTAAKQGYTYAVDLEKRPVLAKQVITKWHECAKTLKAYAGHNVKFDMHMMENVEMPYKEANLTDTMFYIRYAHDALTPKYGGPPLKLKDYTQRYITPDAKVHEQALQRERSSIAKHLNIKLKQRVKCTLKQLQEIFKDPIVNYTDLPKDMQEAYTDWLSQDVPLYLQNKITALAKPDIIPYNTLDRQNIITYGHLDIVYTLEILMSLIPVVEARRNTFGVELENKLIHPFYQMERTGFKINKEYLTNAKVKLKKYILDRRETIHDMVGQTFAIGQHALVKSLFEKQFGLELPSTGKEILNTIRSDLVRSNAAPEAISFIDILQELRTLEKWYSVYLTRFENNLQGTDRLHTQLNQVGTVSGRITSDFQQFPKKGIYTEAGEPLFNPREMVVPTEKAIVYLDYSQIELRFQAFYTILVEDADMNMCRAYMPYKCINQKGETFDYKNIAHVKSWDTEVWHLEETPEVTWTPVDLHGATTALATGLTPEHPDFAKLRNEIGKRTNFAKNYGAQLSKIQEMFPEKTEEEAKQINDAYYKAFPGVKSYHNYCYARAKNTAYTQNLFGVRYYNVSGHKLINILIQGSAAYFLKIKIAELYDYMQKQGLKTKLQMQIHDELCWEFSSGEEEHMFVFKHIMEDWNETYIPIVAEMDITTTNWADKHSDLPTLQKLKELLYDNCD